MRFHPLDLDGLVLVQLDRREDHRGYFARTFCIDEFAAAGLPTAFPQASVSFNRARGTLRGMHWQADPYQEGKLIRCTRGKVFDVAVDIRPRSPTFARWTGVTLSAETEDAIYIPEGFAHGFQTLEDDSELLYQMTIPYQDGMARGLHHADPAIAIPWPLQNPILSDRDAALPPLTR